MKRPTINKGKPSVAGRKGDHDREARAHRGWGISLGLAVVIVGAAIGLSAVINPLLGRYVHWDWMAFLAPTLLVALAIALRRRWV
jgi:hypothetical protein